MKLPVLGICGYSGSGKTTLIENLIPHLTARGLRVLTIKHDVHGLVVDRKGKDSDRFYCAGSDVLVNGPDEQFSRCHSLSGGQGLTAMLRQMVRQYDLILVEGHKSTPLPYKIWLRRNAADKCPAEVGRVMCDLGRKADRQALVRNLVDSWLPKVWKTVPVYGGILIGGASKRMGTPKHLIRSNGRTWLENTVAQIAPHVDEVVILGKGRVPSGLKDLQVLPDVKDMKGPLAGILSAMRWNPSAAWVFAACDMPMISSRAVKWLISKRAPGLWAVMPSLPGNDRPEPLFAYYDFRAKSLLENCSGPVEMAASSKVAVVEAPAALALAWTNVNRRADLFRVLAK